MLGGLVGINYEGTIINCYATGLVTGDDDLGGLVGYDNSGIYNKSFWDKTVNAGLGGIGNKVDPANVIAETTENMQKQATFTKTRSHLTMVRFPTCPQPEREKARSHLTMVRFTTCPWPEHEKVRSHLTIRLTLCRCLMIANLSSRIKTNFL